MSRQDDDFFVGYLSRWPATLKTFLPLVALLFIAGFAVGAIAVSATQDDPGNGAIQWGQRLTERGYIYAEPYPHLRQAPTAEHPQGRTFTMVRAGKRGVQDLATRFDGQFVEVLGVWTRRGELEMIQAGGRQGKPAVAAVEPDYAVDALTVTEDLGRWRIAGEICDGKCYLGAMRPGRGLAHKACANLCIIGGAPAVLVTAEPVEGTEFLLLADETGAPLPEGVYDLTAILIEAEGQLERRGDLLVFKIDFDSVRRL
ncbi:MAG: hypothetical protein AAF661_14540 [Pseudomonadota bacterium]